MWNHGWPIETLDRYPEAVLNARRADVIELGEHCRRGGIVGLLGDEPLLRTIMAARR
jgi:hypothetical protein